MYCLTCSWVHLEAHISEGHTRQLYWLLLAFPSMQTNFILLLSKLVSSLGGMITLFAVGPASTLLGHSLCGIPQRGVGLSVAGGSWVSATASVLVSHSCVVDLPPTRCHCSVLLVDDLLWDNLLWNKFLFTKEV